MVATANDPSVLDPAILARPGRFDRVILFPRPGRELRRKYFHKFCPDLTREKLADCLAGSEGLSFAQLREVYILAGQRAYEKGQEITGRNLAEAVCTLRQGLLAASERKHELGFFAPSQATTADTEEVVKQ